jgi:hypothetical protein
VLRYLARYTHRIAITNRRLLACDHGQVTFRWKDYRHGNRQRCMTLDAVEFLRRFLLHVLPRGFQRIRHYGFLANGVRQAKLARCRQLLGQPLVSRPEACPPVDNTASVSRPQPLAEVCPRCHAGRMHVQETWWPQRTTLPVAPHIQTLDTS